MGPTTAAAKVCISCGVEKPLAQYHRGGSSRDGRQPRCKPCACKRVREYRAANLEAYRARDRAEDRTPERRAYWKARRERRDGVKARTHAAVAYAIKTGRLVPAPCEVCGEAKVDGHHDDYSKPLDVRWLCRVCHAAHHKREADQARAAREAAAMGGAA